MTKEILFPDFCVIGAGSAGLSFSAGAVQMGASVVLIERNKMGGDCLNYGCVPSKALLSIAKTAHIFQHKIDFKKVYNHVHKVIDAIAPHDSVERFEKLGVQVLLEEAKFCDASTVETTNFVIKAKRFIIATGSMPFIPSIIGLETISYYTNESIFDLQELPSHLLIIGGGPIGIEMAQAFRRLGSEVTVLEMFSALPKDDPEITEKLKKILCSEGINLQESVKIAQIKSIENGVECLYKNSQGDEIKLTASHVLVATGRRPRIQNLNLEDARVKFSQKGIDINSFFQTSNSKVYAIGDCTGGYQFTHVAGHHAGIVIRNSIFGLRFKMDVQSIPWVTYTDPELAHIGFLEHQLKEKKIKYKVLRLDFNENDRAQIEGRTEGSIKVLVSSKGYILGATILGVCAGELIHPWIIAIQNKLKISAFVNCITPYPTFSEISKRLAGQFYAEKIFSSWMQKIVRFLIRWKN